MPDTDLSELARRLINPGPIKVFPTIKRVRIRLNAAYVADTTDALMVWEHEGYPWYYLPTSSFVEANVTQGDAIFMDPKTSGAGGAGEAKAIARKWTITVGDKSTTQVLEVLEGRLKGYVRVTFGSVDGWLEEDTPIHVHPKDPFKRIDIIQSLRPIRVTVLGRVVAESPWAVHLYETALPTRYYIPPSSVDPTVLRKSSTTTDCPYKGTAEYYDVVIDGQEAKNVVWYYDQPLLESAQIAGLVCFYNEKVDITVGGKEVGRPKTKWS